MSGSNRFELGVAAPHRFGIHVSYWVVAGSAGTSSSRVYCGWCGQILPHAGSVGRPRRYCGQPCRQRAYEQRATAQRSGLPADAVIFSGEEFGRLQDRLYQMRCAAEDITVAVADGVSREELGRLAAELAAVARSLERVR